MIKAKFTQNIEMELLSAHVVRSSFEVQQTFPGASQQNKTAYAIFARWPFSSRHHALVGKLKCRIAFSRLRVVHFTANE